jgi:hypothetical protein
MSEFSEVPSGAPVSGEALRLLERVRDGRKAEEELWVFCQTERGKAWLRAEKVLDDGPDSDTLLADALEPWHEELVAAKDARARFAGLKAFVQWVGKQVARMRKARTSHELDVRRAERAVGIEGMREQLRDAGLPWNGSARTLRVRGPKETEAPLRVDSHSILVDPLMQRFDAYYTRPDVVPREDPFDLLCHTLYRLLVWRYVVRKVRQPNATPLQLRMLYPHLAALVHGFHLDKDMRKSKGTNLGNWLAPSVNGFYLAIDRMDAARSYDEAGDDPD